MRVKTMIYNHAHTDKGSNIRLIDCTNKVDTMIDTVVELGMKGAAITDHESLSAHIEALQYVKKGKKKGSIPEDFKLILGNEIYLVDSLEEVRDNYVSGETKFYHFILLAKDRTGHDQLRKLSSIAWDNSFYTGQMERVPTIKKDVERIITGGHVIASTACFLKGTMVQTNNGLKPIEEVNSGDIVLTHNCNWEMVNYPTNRQFNGNIHTIQTQGSAFPVQCTDNHKFFVITKNDCKNYTKYETNDLYYKEILPTTTKMNRQRLKKGLSKFEPQWIEAKDIKEGDYLLTPIETKIVNIEYLDFTHLQNTEYSKYATRLQQLNSYKIPVTKELLEIIGLFIAEGNFRNVEGHEGITFTFHKEETELINKVVNYFEALGVNSCINPRKNSKAIAVTINSKIIYNIFVELFGGVKNAFTKRVPKFVRYLPPDLQMHLLKGYILGDGHIKPKKRPSGRRSRNITTTTVSRELTQDLVLLFHRNYINPNLYISKEKTDKNGVHHAESYYLEINGKIVEKLEPFITGQIDRYVIDYNYLTEMHIPVIYQGNYYMKQKVKKNTFEYMETTVHCLNVKKDHSFVANGVVVHNCLGGEFPQLVLDLIEVEQTGNEELIYNKKIKIHQFLTWCIKVFGQENFFIELQPSYSEEQIVFNKKAIEIASAYKLRYIITTDSHYLQAEDRPVHEAFLKSTEGERELDDFYESTYFMTIDEIFERMSYLDEEVINTALENTLLIGEMVEDYDLYHSVVVPRIDLPKFELAHTFKKYYDMCPYIKKFAYSDDEQDRYYLYLVEKGLKEKEPYILLSKEEFEKRVMRINAELMELWEIAEVINTKISSYYITTREIINIMWNEGDSLVGVARGSVTGWYTAYLMDITQMNPLKWGLPHWRHIHHSRPDLPDYRMCA